MTLYLGTTPIADGASAALLAGKADVDLSNVNASGTSLASGWAMPSSRYIDLTLGANGSTYAAPANGYFELFCKSNTTSGWYGCSAGLLTIRKVPTPTKECTFSIPAKKSVNLALYYDGLTLNFTESYHSFRFVYAEGEQ